MIVGSSDICLHSALDHHFDIYIYIDSCVWSDISNVAHMNLTKHIHILLVEPEKLEGNCIVGSGRKLKRSIFWPCNFDQFFRESFWYGT